MRFSAIINPDASTLKGVDCDQLVETLETRFAERGWRVAAELAEGSDMPKALRKAIDDDNVDAVLAGGGDGTISAAAGMLQGTGKPLAVLPGGNMNFFARTLGIPLDLDAAIAALASGDPKPADIAFANDRPFIHEFSLGLHPEMIEERDKQKFGSRAGKIIGSLRSLSRAIIRPPRVRVWLKDDERPHRPILTPILAVSTNPYGLGHLPYADTIDDGRLGVYVARTMRAPDLVAITARMASGTWDGMETLEFFTAETLRLTRRRPVKAAIDGEVVRMRCPIEIRIEPGALSVIVPDEAHAIRGQ